MPSWTEGRSLECGDEGRRVLRPSRSIPGCALLLWGALVGGGPRAGAAQGNAPSAGRVITAEAIAKSGAKTAWDALRLAVPNVQLREVRGQPARIQRRGRASIDREVVEEDAHLILLVDARAPAPLDPGRLAADLTQLHVRNRQP